MKFTNLLKGISGEFEIIRVLGAGGILVYVLAANIFEAYVVFHTDKGFDVVAYCAAFPAGLGVAIAAVAGSAAVKDRNVAVARQVQDTGTMPAPATPPMQEVKVINPPSDPANVQETSK